MIKDEIDEFIKQEETKEEQKIDAMCQICYNIMVEPCKLECSHRFCIICVEKEFTDFDYDYCPMCRNHEDEDLDLSIDEAY